MTYKEEKTKFLLLDIIEECILTEGCLYYSSLEIKFESFLSS